MPEREHVQGKISNDIAARYRRYREDHDLNQSQAVERLVDDGLRRNGYTNGGDPAVTRWLRESGKGSLYFAAGAIAVALWTNLYDVAIGATLFMLAGAALLALSLHGETIQRTITGVVR